MRLLIIGNPVDYHVGAHFLAAAQELSWEAEIIDLRLARSSSLWVNRLFDRAAKRRPAYLGTFSRKVAAECGRRRPEVLLSTGIAPLRATDLRALRNRGVTTVSFLTDDPWNIRNGSGFFWKALIEYDLVLSPRLSNLDDLREHGCRRVQYLPFGYNPDVHYREAPNTDEERGRFSCDVAILGGADEDRVPMAEGLVAAGLNLALYGGYWNRSSDLRPYYRGSVYGRDLRLAACGAAAQVCMVRRANRDGHAMRSFELPAMGASLLAEDTAEHRALYGAEGDCVLYWGTIEELRGKARLLTGSPEITESLRGRVHHRIVVEGQHRYQDRLATIAEMVRSLPQANGTKGRRGDEMGCTTHG